jgi:magnesium-transporting ATPase (P-type)
MCHLHSNATTLQVILYTIFQVMAQDVCVGDVVWLQEDAEVPCDLVLLGTSDPMGHCYVQVSRLQYH